MSDDSNWGDRIRELERSNRRLRRSQTGLCALALLLVTGSFQTTAERSLRVQDVRIVDEQGRERAILGSKEGVPELSFLDETGAIQATLGLSTGRENTAIPKGDPVLSLGPPSSPRVTLGVAGNCTERAFPSLALMPPGGEGVSTLLSSSKVGASVGFMSIGSHGVWGAVPRALFSVPTDGPAEMQLRDPEGKLAFSSLGAIEWNGSNFFPVGRAEDVIALARLAPTPRLVECLGPGVTDEVLGEVSRIEGIRSLALRGCSGLSEAGLRSIAAMHLEALYLAHCPGLSHGNYQSLVDSGVERLVLVDMPLDDTAVDTLAKMKGLKELTLLFRGELLPSWEGRLKAALPDTLVTVGDVH